MRSRLLWSVTATALATAVVGCEGRTTGTLTTGPTGNVSVRVFNAVSSSQAVDFVVDGQLAASGIPLGGASPFVPLTIGTHRLQVRSSANGTTLVDFTRDLATPGAFSLVPAPGLSQFGALLLADDLTPVAGQARLRVVHAAAAPGPVSVFVTAPVADLGSAAPIVPVLGFGLASAYVSLPPGTYRVRVTRAGSPGEVLLDTDGVTVGSGSVRTLLLTDAPGGGLPTSLSVVADAN